MAEVRRETKETRIVVRLAIGTGRSRVATEVPFLTHMLETLARYAGLDLEIEASGDLEHHVVEDVAITLGQALRDVVPETCRRYGEATVAMDDALVQVALDCGGRAYYEGPLPTSLAEHFFRSLADNAAVTLHARALRGSDRHHVVEAAFKALGLALRRALASGDEVFSTKGSVELERDPQARPLDEEVP